MRSRCALTKISALELIRKSIKSALLVGLVWGARVNEACLHRNDKVVLLLTCTQSFTTIGERVTVTASLLRNVFGAIKVLFAPRARVAKLTVPKGKNTFFLQSWGQKCVIKTALSGAYGHMLQLGSRLGCGFFPSLPTWQPCTCVEIAREETCIVGFVAQNHTM